MCGVSASAESDQPVPNAGVHWYRLPLLLSGGIALAVGICTGLVRLGVNAPLSALSEYHGPLLICGLFGTLTSLERAAMSHRRMDYLAPILCAAGTVLVLYGATWVGGLSYVLAAVAVSASTVRSMFGKRTLFASALAVSALAWLTGNIVWLYTASAPEAAGWWLAFLTFVIGGERLEFGGPRPRGRSFSLLFWASLVFVVVGGWTTIADPAGALAFGIGLILCSLWMIRNDIEFCMSFHRGEVRFLAINLAVGYVWLAIGGFILTATAFGASAFSYDMTIHAVVIGFAVSMVFGHALLIFPSIVRAKLAFSRMLYAPVVLLHAALALRIAGGLAEWNEARMFSGSMTALSLVAFAAIVVVSTWKIRGRRLTPPAHA